MAKSDLVQAAEAEVNRLATLEVSTAAQLRVARETLKSIIRSFPTNGKATDAQTKALDEATMREVDLERELRQARADLRRARASAARARTS